MKTKELFTASQFNDWIYERTGICPRRREVCMVRKEFLAGHMIKIRRGPTKPDGLFSYEVSYRPLP